MLTRGARSATPGWFMKVPRTLSPARYEFRRRSFPLNATIRGHQWGKIGHEADGEGPEVTAAHFAPPAKTETGAIEGTSDGRRAEQG